MTGGPPSATPSASGAPGWLFWPFLLTVLGAPALLGANRPAAWSLLAISALLAFGAIYLSNRLVGHGSGV